MAHKAAIAFHIICFIPNMFLIWAKITKNPSHLYHKMHSFTDFNMIIDTSSRNFN